MIIACDLDRTLLPNGEWEDDGSLSKFYNFVKDQTLVYVSGRNMKLYKDAEKEFGISKPDYFLAAVGTEVFVRNNNDLIPDPDWDEYLKKQHPNWNRLNIAKMISENIIDHENFYLQEDFVQNDHKISYYLKNTSSKEKKLDNIKNLLSKEELNIEVIYSFDPQKQIGLIDILPTKATKMGALEFLIEKLGKTKKDVIYAGDSGNDLLPIAAGIKSILVRNAPDEIKEKAMKIAKEGNLYIAKGTEEGNGYYSSGVLEGLKFFGIK